jgi:hypothetical protein
MTIRDDDTRGKPLEDEMQSRPEDVVGELTALASDPDSGDGEILSRLEVLARNFTVEEVFAVMLRYDTPDLLG